MYTFKDATYACLGENCLKMTPGIRVQLCRFEYTRSISKKSTRSKDTRKKVFMTNKVISTIAENVCKCTTSQKCKKYRIFTVKVFFFVQSVDSVLSFGVMKEPIFFKTIAIDTKQNILRLQKTVKDLK